MNNRHTTLAALALTAVSLLNPASGIAGELAEFSAYYEARTNGISGSAERHLIKLDDEVYRLNISLEAKMAGIAIGDLEQASEFTMVDAQIKPQNYSYQVTGVTQETRAISFNWDAHLALSTENEQSWTIELGEQALDQLSYQVAMANALQQQDYTVGTELSFQLVDGSELETQLFRVLGDETLSTPMGNLDCVKLQRVREDDSGRSTTIWLAKDWDFLLARIEQVSGSGMRIELALENALVRGEQVVALP